MNSTSPLFSFFLLLLTAASAAADTVPLLSLKSQIDPTNVLNWSPPSSSSLCATWTGVKACNSDGRVTKLILEFLNLTGTLTAETLAPLDQIRVLSFKSNSLSGPIPDLSPLLNLKSLFLNSNLFSGQIPASLSSLHRLKIVNLADNRLSGEIPTTFPQIRRLYTLLLQNNRLTGQIPNFNQSTLKFLNVSGNALSGEIPATAALSQFNASSFLNLPNLCGVQIQKPCPQNSILPPISPPTPHHKNHKKLKIIACSLAAFVGIVVVLTLALLLCNRRKGNKSSRELGGGVGTTTTSNAAAAKGGGEFSWENEGIGRLVFIGGGGGEMYSLEELLKASAETMGRGTVGSTYKAVMESGFIVTVKRLRDGGGGLGLGVEEFRRKMEELGRLRHPNLVPLRAYFQAKEERLLVYDYFPNGSLFSLVHGTYLQSFLYLHTECANTLHTECSNKY